MEQIVKNTSRGYGYSYASLADFAKQGVTIPAMKTGIADNGAEYVFYKAEDGTWQQGARVIIPISKKMNEAQAYGAGLTYARRYTVALALGIATDDDVNVENHAPRNTTQAPPKRKNPQKSHVITDSTKATSEQIATIKAHYQGDKLTKLLEFFKTDTLENVTYLDAKRVMEKIEAHTQQ